MCSICMRTPCLPGCPNYEPPKANFYCSICGEGIYEGEEYIVNDNFEYAHWDCVDCGRDLADFLGYETKIMKGNYDYRDYFYEVENDG